MKSLKIVWSVFGFGLLAVLLRVLMLGESYANLHDISAGKIYGYIFLAVFFAAVVFVFYIYKKSDPREMTGMPETVFFGFGSTLLNIIGGICCVLLLFYAIVGFAGRTLIYADPANISLSLLGFLSAFCMAVTIISRILKKEPKGMAVIALFPFLWYIARVFADYFEYSKIASIEEYIYAVIGMMMAALYFFESGKLHLGSGRTKKLISFGILSCIFLPINIFSLYAASFIFDHQLFSGLQEAANIVSFQPIWYEKILDMALWCYIFTETICVIKKRGIAELCDPALLEQEEQEETAKNILQSTIEEEQENGTAETEDSSLALPYDEPDDEFAFLKNKPNDAPADTAVSEKADLPIEDDMQKNSGSENEAERISELAEKFSNLKKTLANDKNDSNSQNGTK